MKEKVNKLVENSKNEDIHEMYKGIIEFKKGYEPRAYVIRKYDCRIVADTTSILSRWEQFYSNLLNVNQSTNLEGSEIYTTTRHPKADSLELVLTLEY